MTGRFLFRLGILIVALACMGTARAQIVTTGGLTAQDLLDSLARGAQGVNVFNPQLFITNPAQVASFRVLNNDPDLGMSSGIILSSGDADSVIGPNDDDGYTDGFAGGAISDPQLINEFGAGNNDQAVFQFQFEPIGDTAQFTFLFGSEEYLEFADACGANFNDVFGFFIQGPLYPTFTNIALLPGVAPPTPITINNVNPVFNPSFYINNDINGPGGGADPLCPPAVPPAFLRNTQMDGFTIPITIRVEVVPCSTYTLKFGVADAGDQAFDTWVLIEAGSFTSNAVTSELVGNTDSTGTLLVNEGCFDGRLVVSRASELTDTLPLIISGTATPGVDYQAFPDTIFFPPGKDTVQLLVFPTFDGLTEGDETIQILAPSGNLCEPGFDTLNVLIQDVPAFQATYSRDTIDVCPDTPLDFDIGLSGGLPDSLDYTWTLNGQEISDTTTFSIFADSTSLLRFTAVTRGCNIPPYERDMILRAEQDPLFLNVTPDLDICRGDDAVMSVGISGGVDPYTIQWFNAAGAVVGNSDTLIERPGSNTRYIVEVSDSISCQTSRDTVNVFVDGTANVNFSFSSVVQCESDPVTVIHAAAGPNTTQYTWSFPGGTPTQSTGAGNKTVTYQTPGTYPVTLSAFGAVCTSSVSRSIEIIPVPSVTAGPDKQACSSTGVTLDGDASVDISGCTLTWTELGGGVIASDTLTPLVTPTSTTQYEVALNCGSCGVRRDTTTVTVLPSPTLSPGTTTVDYCSGELGVTIGPAAVINAPGSQSTFEWFPSTDLSNPTTQNPRATPNATTTYRMIARSLGNACPSDTAFYTVNVNQLPVPRIAGDAATCRDSIATLDTALVENGSGNYSFQWFPVSAFVGSDPTVVPTTVQPNASSVYVLQVTDNATGCVSDTTQPGSRWAVNLNEPVTASIPQANVTICEGGAIRIGDRIAGTRPELTYTWTPTDGLQDPTSGYTFASPDSTTTYTLQVLQPGCVGQSATVTVNVRLPWSISLADTVPQICFGDSAQLTVIPGTTAPSTLTYAWQRAQHISDATIRNPRVAPPDSTTYTVVVTDEVGCQATAETFVPVAQPPFLDADRNNTDNRLRYCFTDTSSGIELDAFVGPNVLTFNWINPDVADPDTLTPIVNPSTTTDYILRAPYGESLQCETFDTVTVDVLPGLIVTIAPSADTVCTGSPITLDASAGRGAATYSWTPTTGLNDPTAPIVEADPPLLAGDSITYSVEVREAGCVGTHDTTIFVVPGPTAVFSSVLVKACSPAEAVFLNRSTNARRFLWEFGDDSTSTAASPSHIYQAPGAYTPRLIAYGGETDICADTLDGNVLQVYDSVDVQFSSDYTPGDTLYLPEAIINFQDQTLNASTWFWDFGDGSSAAKSSPSHQYQEPGVYDVTVSVQTIGGCIDTAALNGVLVAEPLVQINNVFTPNGDGRNDRFLVNYQGGEPFLLEIYDRWNNQVFSTNNVNEGWDGTDEGSELAAGTFFYRVKIGEYSYRGTVLMLK